MKLAERIIKLNPLIGTWSIEGTNFSAAPDAPETPVTGVWKVNVMEGGQFLESHWKYDFGSDQHIGLSVLGMPDDAQLKMFNFDNGGFYRSYELTIEDQTWHIIGNTERATLKFEKSGKAYNEFWEIKTQGKWQPLCKRVGTKR